MGGGGGGGGATAEEGVGGASDTPVERISVQIKIYESIPFDGIEHKQVKQTEASAVTTVAAGRWLHHPAEAGLFGPLHEQDDGQVFEEDDADPIGHPVCTWTSKVPVDDHHRHLHRAHQFNLCKFHAMMVNYRVPRWRGCS